MLIYGTLTKLFNPLTAKLFNLNFHPLEVVSRWRDLQFQMSENYSDLTRKNWIFTHFKLCLADAIHNFKWVKIIQIWQNGGHSFQILLVDVTFYL